jgi:hypothetical protein
MLTIFLLASMAASACDVCGCSLGGNYFGLLPALDKNFVGLRWSQAKFYAYMNHQSDYFQEEYSHDTYRRIELWGRFAIGERVQLFAFVPYLYNDMNGSAQQLRANGLGDISVTGNYRMYKTVDEKSVFQQTILLGGGVKIPTGSFNMEDRGKLVNPNFQMGTGSLDFMINAIYNIKHKRVGLNAESGYKMNTRNKENYKFGNQFYLSASLLYSINVGAFTFLPNAGVYYEQAANHKEGNVTITNTGGKALFLSAGLETYLKMMSFGVNYKSPLSQTYNSDSIADIEAQERWMVSVTYSF